MDEQLAIHVSQSDQVCFKINTIKYPEKSFNSSRQRRTDFYVRYLFYRRLRNSFLKNNLTYQQS